MGAEYQLVLNFSCKRVMSFLARLRMKISVMDNGMHINQTMGACQSLNPFRGRVHQTVLAISM